MLLSGRLAVNLYGGLAVICPEGWQWFVWEVGSELSGDALLEVSTARQLLLHLQILLNLHLLQYHFLKSYHQNLLLPHLHKMMLLWYHLFYSCLHYSFHSNHLQFH